MNLGGYLFEMLYATMDAIRLANAYQSTGTLDLKSLSR